MDELKAIEKLVERAKLEPADVPSVADGILERMHHSPPRRITPLSVLAAASAVAATIVLAMGLYFWMASPGPLTEMAAPDPLTELYTPVQVGGLW